MYVTLPRATPYNNCYLLLLLHIFFNTVEKCIACLSLEVVIVVIESVGKCVRETQGKNRKILTKAKNERVKKHNIH